MNNTLNSVNKLLQFHFMVIAHNKIQFSWVQKLNTIKEIQCFIYKQMHYIISNKQYKIDYEYAFES